MKAPAWTKIFRQEVQVKKNPRIALQQLRALLDNRHPGQLVSALRNVPLFKSAIAKNGMPTRFSDLWASPRLKSHGLQADLAWTIEVLSLFPDEINNFLKVSTQFENAYMMGEWDRCLSLLAGLEEQHGLSIWLISRRLSILKIAEKSSEANYANSLINSSPDGTLMSFLVYMLEFRSDPNVTPAMYLNQVEKALSPSVLSDALKAFLRYHTLSTPPRSFQDCEMVIAVSESAPLFDRYIAVLDVLQSLASNAILNDELRLALFHLTERLGANINDYRLEILVDMLDVSKQHRLVSWIQTSTADAYTEGRYDDALEALSLAVAICPSDSNQFELIAQTMMRSAGQPDLPPRIDEIVRHIVSIRSFSEDEESSYLALSREGLSGVHRLLSASIRALFASEDPMETSPEQIVEALNSRVLTPLQIRHLPLPDPSRFFSECKTAYPGSLAIGLQNSVVAFGQKELDPELMSRLPEDRGKMYYARSLSRLNDYDKAIGLLHDLAANENQAVANDALRELFSVFRHAGRSRDALRLVARAHKQNDRLFSMFRLGPLLEEVQQSEAGQPFDEISLSICHHINNRLGNGEGVGAQADAAEEYSLHRGADRPSQIHFETDDTDLELASVYLDEVCSPTILDRFMTIDSAAEVELERLEICRILSEIDANRRQKYLDEIREITRRRVVRERFQQVERTKIYVDTDGIKRQAEKNLRDTFVRLNAAMIEGGQDSQRVELVRKVQKLLSEVNADGVKIHFPDLPGNEADVVFERLVLDVMRLLISSQEYGLEAYLSTRVRHGTMGNQLRSAFELHSILTQRDAEQYQPNYFWPDKLGLYNDEARDWLAGRLAIFSADLDGAIEDLVRKRVQVRSETFPEGLFRFQAFNYDTFRIQSEISTETSFDTFLEKVIDQFWVVLENSLIHVRSYIEQDFLNSIRTLTEELERDFERELVGVNSLALRDAIAAARTQMSISTASVANWFTLARDMERPDYEFGIAVEVATESIRACHPNLDIGVERSDDVTFECRGRTLESLVYILFTALDNAIEHSGLSDKSPRIQLETELSNGWLLLRLRNSCTRIDDTEAANTRLQVLKGKLQSDADVRGLATKEGGSGYAKIIRILRHDLLARHTLDFKYQGCCEYVVDIGIEAKAVVK